MYDYSIRSISIDLYLVHTLGLEAALVFSALQHLKLTAEVPREDEFFSATFDDLYIFTALGRNKLNKAINTLEAEFLIETKVIGMPRRLHVKVRYDGGTERKYHHLVVVAENEISQLIKDRNAKISEYYQ